MMCVCFVGKSGKPWPLPPIRPKEARDYWCGGLISITIPRNYFRQSFLFTPRAMKGTEIMFSGDRALQVFSDICAAICLRFMPSRNKQQPGQSRAPSSPAVRAASLPVPSWRGR